jgi:hypothetical protein
MIWFQEEKRAMLAAVFGGGVQRLVAGAIFAKFWPA